MKLLFTDSDVKAGPDGKLEMLSGDETAIITSAWCHIVGYEAADGTVTIWKNYHDQASLKRPAAGWKYGIAAKIQQIREGL